MWKQILASKVTPWVLLGLGAITLIGWVVIGGLKGRAEPLARRWNNEIGSTATPQFKSLLASPPNPRLPVPVYPPDWGKTQVAVYTVPTIKPEKTRPTLRDLADIGQAHAIDFLADGSVTVPHSWADLQKALVDPKEAAPGDRDPFVFDRTLVATVTKGVDWEPGDRMVWSRVLIQPINFLFAGYTVAATENEMVRVTSIETTRTKKFSAELGLTFSGLGGPKASLGPSDERTLKSAEDINAQFEKLGIDIMPNFLRVIRESETGGDVRGNTLVSLSVVTDPSTILNQVPEVAKEDRKKPLGADVVLLVVDTNLDDGPSRTNNEPESISVLPQVPLPHCPLLARVWMFYQKREIARGRESYVEGLQDVRLIEDVYPPKDVEIVSADDVAPAAWSIKILPRGQVEHGGVDDGPFVEAGVGDGPWRSLVFTDYTKASKLAHWLRLNSEDMVTKEGTKAKLGELNFKYPPRASFVPFKTTRTDVCQPNADQKNRGSYQQGG